MAPGRMLHPKIAIRANRREGKGGEKKKKVIRTSKIPEEVNSFL